MISEKPKNNNNNNNPIVGITQGWFQSNLDKKPVPRLRVELTINQLFILKQFYMNAKPLSQAEVWTLVNGKYHQNTIKLTFKLLELHGLIKRAKCGNFGMSKAHTYADKRYKFYILTPEGEEEFENQISVRPLI